jgi:hypothetical protein
MAKDKSFESMNYEELEAEKRKVAAEIAELKETQRKIAGFMDKRKGELRLRRIAGELSPEDKEQLKSMLD